MGGGRAATAARPPATFSARCGWTGMARRARGRGGLVPGGGPCRSTDRRASARSNDYLIGDGISPVRPIAGAIGCGGGVAATGLLHPGAGFRRDPGDHRLVFGCLRCSGGGRLRYNCGGRSMRAVRRACNRAWSAASARGRRFAMVQTYSKVFFQNYGTVTFVVHTPVVRKLLTLRRRTDAGNLQ